MMEGQEKTDSIFNLQLDAEAKSLLKTAALWARIIAIIAFIEVGLSILSAFIGKQSATQVAGAISAAIIGAVISILLNVFLYRFAQKANDGINSSNQQVFTEGINSLRNYFKIYGILLIIVISIFVIVMLFVLVTAGFSRG